MREPKLPHSAVAVPAGLPTITRVMSWDYVVEW
jgi:hypothetical protein